MRMWNWLLCGCAMGALAGSPAAAISLGQIDDFQAGTLESWGGGANPTNVTTGGPAGSGDRYLQISADSSNLGTNNPVQWAGNYAAAGVTGIRLSLNNAGPDPVALRLNLFGPGGTFTTTNEIELAPGGGWVTADLLIDNASLTRTAGTGTLAQTLANVTQVLLRHDPDPISAPMQGNPVAATLGIDNITAVPEPATGLLVALGLAALAGSRQRARGLGSMSP
jgi:hypothetical protein